jgi:class 3 adenylate cyclase/tetratricopeptide (TPR) repeat protein
MPGHTLGPGDMDTPPLQERKLVTVLFADIAGSTALGERFDPERWHALLQRFFSAMAASIEAWGGTVEKFIGDAVMAVFGVPIMREDDADRALRAGFEMLERLAVVDRDFQAHHGVSLSIRIGINTGDVVTAVGPHLIVSGDPVNVAARLEQMAEPGTILVGERTYTATRDGFVFGPAMSREVKGKSAPVVVRQALRPVADSLERRVGMQVPMVGREREIESLVDLFHEALETGSPRMAVIQGPAGIGKSRLVREFLNLASAQHGGTTILQGRCPSAGQGITYWGFGDLLRRACEISLDDPADVAQERLRSQVERVFRQAGVNQLEIDHTIFALAITAGIHVAGNPLEELRPVAVANEIAIAWPRFVSAHAAAGPVILVIEDLHWAGDQLVAVLERLLARSAGRVLLIAAARPEFSEMHPGFAAGRDDVGVVSLRPLTTTKGIALFNEILAGSQVPEPFRDELVAKAAGNPLFLEEILRRLIETGTLFRANEHWQADATVLHQQLPDTVQAVLAARIDALGSAQKRALQEAAVIGQIFWEEPVGQAAADAEISATLAGLESKGLISARPTSTIANQTEFAFRHALVRDVAYASLSRVRRARAHAEAGRWIAKLAGERREELAELIAHHYRMALLGEDADLAWVDEDAAVREQLRRDALDALLVAGAAARKRYAIPKALELHQEALRVSRDARERAQVLEQIGDDHEGAFQGDDAVAAWEGALAALGDDEDAARVRMSLKCAKMTGIRWGGFKVVPPISKVEGYIDAGMAARPGRAERGWLLALRAYCGARWTGGHEGDPSPDRVRAGEDARSIAGELRDVDMEVLATRALSGLAVLRGDYQEAMTFTREELAIVDRITASRDRALSLFFMGLRFTDIEGDYEQGLALAERSHVLGKQLTPHEVMHADYLRLYGDMALGRWSEIDAILEEHVIAFRQDSDMACPYARGGPLIGATVLAHRGELDRARETAALVSTDPDAPWLPLPLALQGIFLLAAGAPVEARQLAEQVLATGRPPTIEEAPLELIVMLDALIALRDADGLRTFLPKARATRDAMALLPPAIDRAEGVLHLWEGDQGLARQRLGQALQAYRRLGNVFESARTQELLSQVLPPEAATSARSDALSGYQGLGAEPFAARLRNATASTVNRVPAV